MPIYGEKYQERALRSLLDQTLEDIEFILVDDRSPDSAYDIAMRVIAEEQYAHLKDNIKIIRHEVNMGVPAVRRNGWEASTGDYIYQCDSDDWADPDFLRKLWEKADEGGYDIVECDFLVTDGLGNFKERNYPYKYKPFEDWMDKPRAAQLLNKIVKRSVYQNEITWPQEHYMEDYVLSTQLYYYAKSYCYIDEPLFYYFQNPQGIMKTIDIRRQISHNMKQMGILEDFIRSKGLYDKYKDLFAVNASTSMFQAWELPRKEFLKVYPEKRLDVLLCKCIPFKEKMGHLSKALGIHGVGKIFGLS